MRLYNRGIHGITSQQLLKHLDSQVIDLNPNRVFLLIGANDLKTRRPEEVYQTIQTIILEIHNQLPETDIVLMSVFPINESPEFIRTPSLRTNHSISQLNAYLSELTNDKVYWLDVHDLLCDESGQLKRDLTLDGLHLTVAGYQVVADIINLFLM